MEELSALSPQLNVTTKKTSTAAVANIATAITWSPMSDLVTGFAYGNGLTFSATYDKDYRIATLGVKNVNNIISLTYAYADGANLLPNDGIHLTAITDNVTAANSQSLWYTPTGRLQNASGPYGDYTFQMDPVGNRTAELKVGAPNKVFGYPANNNRIVSETTGTTLTRSFTYDNAGNILTGLPVGSTYAAVYNKRNRPSGLTLNGTTVATYLFNAMEQLASRALLSPLTPVGTTHYIYDTDGHLIAEATGTTATNAVITREYIWLEGMPVAVIDGVNTASPTTTYVHTDHLTRPIRMTDAAKTTVWVARWLPSGAAYSITSTFTQNLRFPGQYFLIEQGLAYNWHRFYDPTTGRYTQPDPLGFPDGPARYAYALNSPLMYVDPFGLELKGGKRDSNCPNPRNVTGIKLHAWLNTLLGGHPLNIQFGTGGGLFNPGISDMYSPRSGEIWDLKPTSWGSGSNYGSGVDQVLRYVNAANKSPRNPGITYRPGSWSSLFGNRASVSFNHPEFGMITLWPDETSNTGLVFYSCEPKEPERCTPKPLQSLPNLFN